MQYASRYDENIPLLQHMGSLVYFYSIGIGIGHNDFQCGMPVQGIILCFHIVVQLQAPVRIVIHGFSYAI